jgi:hypothetical protein
MTVRFILFFLSLGVFEYSVADIMECIAGAEIKSDGNAGDQTLFLTIVSKSEQGSSRIIAMKMSTPDQRNALLSGLRFVSVYLLA